MQRIGILCACDSELAPFLPHLTERETKRRGMLTFHTGLICGVPVAALYCGVCKVNAAIAAQMLIDGYDIAAIVNSGTAGGVDPAVGLFDTIVSTQSAYHDVDEGILTSYHPRLSSIWFDADARLLGAARRAAEGKPQVRFGRTATGEKFIEDSRRDEIRARLSPLSVDMETAAIAHVCFANGVPFLAVRSITDNAAHEGLGAFEQNCARASACSAAFVLDLLRTLELTAFAK